MVATMTVRVGKVLLACCLVGCSVDVPESDVGGEGRPTASRYYVGLVRIDDRTTDEAKVQRRIVETLGLRMRDGFSLGWMKEDLVLVPANCVVVILPREPDAAKDWVDRLGLVEGMQGAQLCMDHED